MPRHARDESDARAELKNLLHPLLSADTYATVEKLIDALAGAEAEKPREVGGAQDHQLAMDAALPGDRDVAIAMVEPYVGRAAVMGCNTAQAVLRSALTILGCDAARTVSASALPEMWKLQKSIHVSRSQGGTYTPPLSASDSANFARRHPDVARIRVI